MFYLFDYDEYKRLREQKKTVKQTSVMHLEWRNPTYRTNFNRLIELRKEVITSLVNHYEVGKGYNWNIGMLNPPIKEPDHNEHFVSLALELTVREKKV